ncbi:molecular chaperone HtpG [Rickettsiales endosymbiont of Peranema trichophorum]|uniref:molecular chaperone HtpG n=1 Tax=Rickettsiales endosymbiont of Peranema trichophorum TaxID=2486577 RepID=UPI001023278C|nr:molecular chaperone HtpG [Rickettsiales endosymbiont of Peranema trichophorum]RZI47661.1 molecular chaperone HtpG [Rickettsiales endosymbiont of Peranema trichophorum]
MSEVRKFDAEVSKILQLVIHSLYTNTDIFLRELISNASDACDKLRYLSIANPELCQSDEKLSIEVRCDKDSNVLIIKDNGIGMDENDMITNLGTIAGSGTQKFLESLKTEDIKKNVTLIGQFGVGFYSAFMVAEEVEVYSTKAGQNKTYLWRSKGDGEYTIHEVVDNQVQLSRGTEIHLKLKPSEVEYLEKYKLQHIVKTYSDHISFPIYIVDAENNSEIANSVSALWMRPKSEITEEAYNEFYHHIAHMPDKPWLTLHNKVEGFVEYTSLLFIPTMKPFDLFHPDRQSRIKLYIKRVFITEHEVALIPPYLRFLRGIIDSEDLPLNISRETLQHNQVVSKIKKSIVKKVLSSLKTKATEEPEDYKKFWLNFGEVMKEGLCEGALEEKEELLELCRFYTTHSGDQIISIDQYIDRMKDGQNQIFFLTGDRIDNLRHSPQLEGFIKRDIEVILLPDHVDDFWNNVVNQYKNKELCSISRSNIDLDAIVKLEAQADVTEDINQAHSVELTKYIKDALGDKIKDVRISTKLIDSPACIAIPEGGMNIRMERYLIEQKQLHHKAPKILEINPHHGVLKKIAHIASTEPTSQLGKELAELVFDQACLIAGEPMSDPYEFTKRINNLLLGGHL